LAVAVCTQNLLVLVFPAGKTTLLRDVARLMSKPENQGGLGMAVVIVDTSNETAGESAASGVERHSPSEGRAEQTAV
jgi:stage III sporulation protein SpoIIIAA